VRRACAKAMAGEREARRPAARNGSDARGVVGHRTATLGPGTCGVRMNLTAAWLRPPRSKCARTRAGLAQSADAKSARARPAIVHSTRGTRPFRRPKSAHFRARFAHSALGIRPFRRPKSAHFRPRSAHSTLAFGRAKAPHPCAKSAHARPGELNGRAGHACRSRHQANAGPGLLDAAGALKKRRGGHILARRLSRVSGTCQERVAA